MGTGFPTTQHLMVLACRPEKVLFLLTIVNFFLLTAFSSSYFLDTVCASQKAVCEMNAASM